jgi:PAS domain S-box-containing protein
MVRERKKAVSSKKSSKRLRRQHTEIEALIEGSKAILKYHDFSGAAQAIFDICKDIIGATSGYISLLSKDKSNNEVVFLDSGGLPCTVDPALPMPIRGMRAEVYSKGKTLFHNNFSRSKWMKFMPEGHVKLRNVLFSPMLLDNKVIGLFGLANKPGGFNDKDVRIALAFSELAAVALVNKRAEEAMRNSEKRLNRSQEIAHLGSWELDLINNVLTWSDEVYRIFGLQPQEFNATYEAFLEAVHPDDRAAVDAAYSGSLQEGRDTYEIEHRVVRKSTGEIRFVHEKCEHIRDESGRIIRSVGMVLDITEHKLAEDALKNAKKLSDYLNSINMVITSSLDFDRIMSGVVVQACKAMGTESAVVVLHENGYWVSKYQYQFLDEAEGIRFSDGEIPEAAFAAKAKRPIIINDTHYDERINHELVKKYGIRSILTIPLIIKDEVIGAITFSYHSSPVTFTKAQVDFAKNLSASVSLALENVKLFEDIKQSEESLRRSRDELEIRVQERTEELRKTYEELKAERQRLYDVLETLPVYVVLLTPDYHVPFANRFFRKRFGESNGKHCYEYLFNRTEPCEICETYKVLKTKLPHHWEWTGPDGRDYDIYDYPFIESGGSTLILEMGIDITERKKAVEALRMSERKYRLLIEQAADAIVILDKQLNIIDVNPAACETSGFKQEDLTHLNIKDLLLTEDLISNPLPLEKLFSGETVREERRIVRKDGSFIDLEASAKLIEGGNIQIMARDITERKESESRGRFITNLLELFAKKESRKEYLDDVVQLIQELTNCRCAGIRINDEYGYIPYESFIGFSPEFLKLENMLSINKDMCACIRTVTRQFEPQDKSILTENGSFYIQNSAEFVSGLTKDEMARFRGNCVRFGFLSIVLVPISYGNKTIGLIHLADEKPGIIPLKVLRFIESVASLIGEAIFRFNTEEALRISETNITEAQRIAHVGNWEWNIKLNKIHCSDEIYRIFGVTPQKFEVTYENFLSLVHQDDREAVKMAVEGSLNERKPYSIEYRIILPDKTVRIVHGKGEVSHDKSGEPVWLIGTVQDITKRKGIEEELTKSREQLRSLYANLQSIREEERTSIAREVHDEFGTILTALKIDLSWLGKRLPEEDRILMDRAQKDLDLVNSAIKVAQRISSELRPGILDHLGLSAAIEWQLKEFSNRTGINYDLSIDIKSIEFGHELPIAVFRIFQESLTNITRHAEATKIIIELKEIDGNLILSVKDNGKGLTEEQIENSSSFGIMGMRERVKYLGGDIKIDSRINGGTSVMISIPVKGDNK